MVSEEEERGSKGILGEFNVSRVGTSWIFGSSCGPFILNACLADSESVFDSSVLSALVFWNGTGVQERRPVRSRKVNR